jgi:hypothetical protein
MAYKIVSRTTYKDVAQATPLLYASVVVGTHSQAPPLLCASVDILLIFCVERRIKT